MSVRCARARVCMCVHCACARARARVCERVLYVCVRRRIHACFLLIVQSCTKSECHRVGPMSVCFSGGRTYVR